jgi:glycosyltransferase involved in cell wall biosynthesis
VRRVGSGCEFVYIGRLSTEKGVDLLIQAWAAAFPAGGHTLRIIGEGPERRRLEALAMSTSKHGSIVFDGQLDRTGVDEALLRARAVIIPSRCYEVFPRVACEAYAFGVPVVGYRVGSLNSIVRHNETGLLCDRDVTTSLRDALYALGERPDLSRRLGEGARRFYDGHLHPAVTTKKLIDIYRSVVVCGERPTKAFA